MSNMLAERVHQFSGSETYDIGSRQACLILYLLDSVACFLFTEMNGHQGQTNNFAWAFWSYDIHHLLIELDQLGQGRQRTISVAFNGFGACQVAKNHGIRHGTVDESKSDG